MPGNYNEKAVARQMLEDCVRLNDDSVQRIRANCETIILGPDLVTVHSTMDNTSTNSIATNMSMLSSAARSACRDLDPSNDMLYLRMRTRKNEVVVASDDEFILITVQNMKNSVTDRRFSSSE